MSLRRRVTVAEASRHSRVPVRTIYAWIDEDRLTVTYRNGTVMVRPTEVDELAEIRESRGGSLPRVDRVM